MYKKTIWVVVTVTLLGLMSQAAGAQEESEGEASEERIVASTMKLTLKNKLQLEGAPVEIEAIKMNSLFGEASIPLHTIAGIRFAQGGNEQTTVVLLNGDALTGEINLTDIKFVSEWGEAKVNVGHIVSIVFRPDLSWSSVRTPNGTRFRLTTSSASGGTDSSGFNNPNRRNFRP